MDPFYTANYSTVNKTPYITFSKAPRLCLICSLRVSVLFALRRRQMAIDPFIAKLSCSCVADSYDGSVRSVLWHIWAYRHRRRWCLRPRWSSMLGMDHTVAVTVRHDPRIFNSSRHPLFSHYSFRSADSFPQSWIWVITPSFLCPRSNLHPMHRCWTWL